MFWSRSILGISLMVGAAGAAVFSDQLAVAADRSAEQILKEIEEHAVPRIDPAKRSDENYVKSFLETRNKQLAKRAELIAELMKADPKNEQLNRLIPEWARTQQVLKVDAKTVDAQLDEFLNRNPDSPIAGNLRAMKVVLLFAAKPVDLPAIKSAIETYEKTPNPNLNAVISFKSEVLKIDPSLSNEQRIAGLKKLIADHPQSAAAQELAGDMRKLEGVGKPFELSFTEAVTGKKMSMADLKGKVVVVDFWATWCGPCVAEMPHMKELYAKFKDRGVEFIGVSLDQPEAQGGKEKLLAFVKDNDITWPQYYQGNYFDSEFSKGWGINSIPSIFAVDANGILVSTEARGQLDTLIPELIAKRDATN